MYVYIYIYIYSMSYPPPPVPSCVLFKSAPHPASKMTQEEKQDAVQKRKADAEERKTKKAEECEAKKAKREADRKAKLEKQAQINLAKQKLADAQNALKNIRTKHRPAKKANYYRRAGHREPEIRASRRGRGEWRAGGHPKP